MALSFKGVPYQKYICRTANVYQADVNGFIVSPPQTGGDVMDLQNQGCAISGDTDPAAHLTQFGSSGASFAMEGNLYRYVGAGLNPGAINTDNVLANFVLPANAFDVAGRAIVLEACGAFASNTNSKRVKLWAGATTAVVGSAISGGQLLADTGAYTTTGAAQFQVSGALAKYGVNGSNTQVAYGAQVIIGATHSGSGVGVSAVPQSLTLTESGTINLTVTGDAVTAVADIALNFFQINALN